MAESSVDGYKCKKRLEFTIYSTYHGPEDQVG